MLKIQMGPLPIAKRQFAPANLTYLIVINVHIMLVGGAEYVFKFHVSNVPS
jgi:hypothetical protein